ncbi:MAG: tetratricopeptide repeat protein [Bacteroidetes bacterium]|nr:tetratricopeptide repeat protein [Bacteroidota bacterium]
MYNLLAYTQNKIGKSWFILDSIEQTQLSFQDKYLFDSILPLYHKANHDSIRLRYVMFLANTLGDERIWPRYNQLALEMSEKGGEDNAFLIYKTYALSNIAFQLSTYKNDTKKAMEIYEDIYKIQLRLNDLTGLSSTTNNMANIYKKQGDIDKAIEWHIKSLNLKEKNHDKLGVGTSLNNLGSIYKDQGDLVSAINCYSKAYKIFDQQNEKRQMALALNNIGRLYHNQGDLNKALENYEKANKLFELVGEKQSMALTITNIGEVFHRNEKYSDAFSYFNRAKLIYESLGDNVGIGNSLIHIAGNYYKLRNTDSAIIALNQSCNLLKKGENLNELANAYGLLADIYFNRNELGNSEKFALEALTIANKLGYPYLIKNPSFFLYKIYKQMGKTGPSLIMFEQYVKMRDSLERVENKRAVLRQQFQSEYEKKAAADSVAQANLRLIEQNKHENEIAQQRLFTYGGVFGFLLMLVIAFVSFNAYRNKQVANKEISLQKHIIEEKQKAIVDSINYAKRIQYTLLAHEDLLKSNLRDFFVLFKPKDIVSGDFYWATLANDKFYLAVCDSTGHGVPGAFMSLLNIGFLSEAINEKGIYSPDHILNYVRKKLIESISKEEQKDGFDGTLICFDKAANRISYASANNRVLIYTNNTLNELGYDKMPVGQGEKQDPFTLNNVNYTHGDILYMLTDGYSDQFGGPQGKKFKYKKFSETLENIASLPLSQQKEKLELAFNEWKGEQEQVDDVCVIGIRI